MSFRRLSISVAQSRDDFDRRDLIERLLSPHENG